MSGDVSAATAQLLQRQASSSRVNLRQYAFAATIANRFYSDNSLARKQRLVEATKRRQAKAHDRAAEQARRVELLQLELAEAERLRTLKEERATARMRLKVSHVAAMYIQFVWRRRVAIRSVREEQRNRAALVVTRSVRRYSRRLKRRRLVAARRIQHLWRAFVSRQHHAHGLLVLGRFLMSFVRARRVTSHSAAVLQRWIRDTRNRRRVAAACCIRQIWRRRCLWRALHGFINAFVEQKRVDKRHRSARVLQRALGQHVVYRRLVATAELREYRTVMALPLSANTDNASNHDALALENAQDIGRKLKTRKAALASQMEQLGRQLETAKTALADERNRLKRHAVVEEYRRVKDEQASSLRLQEAEASMRRQIRMDIERELETARRLMLRSKRRASVPLPSTGPATASNDPRIEIS